MGFSHVKLAQWLICVSLIQFASCASRHTVPSQYRSAIRERAGRAVSAIPPTFVIVVDGFGLETYQRAMRLGTLPEMGRFFTAYRGEAVFPTLTFPNLASIITASTPAQHPISANQILWKGEGRRFDHWQDSGYLNQLLRGSTLFQAIGNRGGSTVSLSYVVSEGATIALKPDVKDALAYESHHYSYIDGKIVAAFDQLVEGPLPDFTFVHLIGVDALSHRHGPEDSRVQAHLRDLDQALGRVFHKLRRLEREGVRTRVVLTADHGFETIRKSVDLTPILSGACTGVRSFNQVRILTLYGKVNTVCAAQLSRASGVQSLLFKNLTGFRSGRPIVVSQGTDRQMMRQLKDFFSSVSAPEAILLPEAGVGFGKASDFGPNLHLGDHGALTRKELEVPVLLHGEFPQVFFNEAGLIPTHRILKDDLSAWSTAQTTAQAPAPAQDWQPKVKFQFELPNAIVKYRSQYLGGGTMEDPQDYSNAFSPRIKTTMDLVWSEHWTTRGYYLAFFSSYIPGNLGYHEAGGALRYRMHSGTYLLGGLSSQQVPFRAGPNPNRDWKKEWVQSLSFGTQTSLLSLGFGELSAKGELSVLLPGKVETLDSAPIPYSSGFREAMSLLFEYDLKARDSISFELGLAHEAQNSAIENREALRWLFGVAYRLELSASY